MDYMKNYFSLGVISILGILIFSFPINAANSDIIINEIGAYEKDGFEWIEIYNKGIESVDLEGWKFYEKNLLTIDIFKKFIYAK